MTTAGDIPRPRKRASQDETAPFPLELMVALEEVRRHHDETAPFPLMLEALRRRRQRVTRHEESPSSLTLAGASQPELESTPRARRAPAGLLPSLTGAGSNASNELREYAARVAAGEDLPPYSGPIWASDEQPSPSAVAARAAPCDAWSDAPRAAPNAPRAHASIENTASLGSPTSPAKVALGLMLMLAALVASATVGDDATLRAAGQAFSRWISGGAPSIEPPMPGTAAAAPAQAPCVTSAATLAR